MTKEEIEMYRQMHYGGLGNGCGPSVTMYVFIGIIIVMLFGACKTTEYVPVVETHTEHHWHTDSVKQVDSVLTEKTTLIREVDSATMAQYGISLRQMERAWLVETDRLNREISRLQTQKSDTVHIVDSVPKIVVKEVEKERSLKDKLSTFARDALISLAVFSLVILGLRSIARRLRR